MVRTLCPPPITYNHLRRRDLPRSGIFTDLWEKEFGSEEVNVYFTTRNATQLERRKIYKLVTKTKHKLNSRIQSFLIGTLDADNVSINELDMLFKKMVFYAQSNGGATLKIFPDALAIIMRLLETNKSHLIPIVLKYVKECELYNQIDGTYSDFCFYLRRTIIYNESLNAGFKHVPKSTITAALDMVKNHEEI